MTVKRYREMSREELEQAAREKGLAGQHRSKEELIDMLESGSGSRQQRQQSGPGGRQQGQSRQASAPSQGGSPQQQGSKQQGWKKTPEDQG